MWRISWSLLLRNFFSTTLSVSCLAKWLVKNFPRPLLYHVCVCVCVCVWARECMYVCMYMCVLVYINSVGSNFELKSSQVEESEKQLE